MAFHGIGKVYQFLADYEKAQYYFRQSLAHLKINGNENLNQTQLTQTLLDLGETFLESNQLDSAVFYLKTEYDKSKPSPFDAAFLAYLGEAYFLQGKTELGLSLMHQSIALSSVNQKNDPYYAAWGFYKLATSYNSVQKPDSAVFYAKLALHAAELSKHKTIMYRSSRLLAQIFAVLDSVQEKYYLRKTLLLNEELYGFGKISELQKTISEEQENRQNLEIENIGYENRIKQLISVGVLVIVMIVAFQLYRNNIQKAKSNRKLEETLAHLKTTQSQLIHAEKMASLGELTAGIAHEIQNPLNFVNNFSEVSKELLVEMLQEFEKGNFPAAKEIATDVILNLDKISYHGKRAEGIVRGMLQHSRTGSGLKEPTDINALADEYLRLSYHGLRAKDKSFNATMNTDYDASIGNIKIISQDIGRVILNLLTNAFYVINEKKMTSGEDYKPTVSLSTKKWEIWSKSEFRIMETVFRRMCLIKYSCRFFQPNQRDREPAWDFP